MRYNNQICDGCGKPFKEDDDIVVCPECATPQHRECYNKNSACVNEHRHSEDFSWQGEINNTPHAFENMEKVKKIPCPNCGYENPEGSEYCKQCSMKFTVFGFNLVDAAAKEQEQEEQETHKPATPEYKAPFALGEGEGFDYETKEETPPTYTEQTDEIQRQMIDAVASVSGFSPAGEDFSFGGPFPKEDRTCGVHTNLLGAFVGTSAMRYIEKFKKFDMGKKLSFNWASFFFAPYWFFYRKLIKPGIVFMTAAFCLSILATPSALAFSEQSMVLMERLYEITTETEYLQLMAEFETLVKPVMFFALLQFLLHLVAGFTANVLYKNYAVKNIKDIMNLKNQKHSLALLLKKGGVSSLYALGSLLAENVISYLVSYLMM